MPTNNESPLAKFAVGNEAPSSPLAKFAVEGPSPLSQYAVKEIPEDTFLGESVTEKELNTIYKKTGVPVEKLRSVLPAYGLVAEGADAGDKALASLSLAALRGAGMNLAQFIAKKKSGPAERQAFDALEELAQQKHSGIATGLEIAGSLLTGGAGIKAAGSLATKLGGTKLATLGAEAAVSAAEGGAAFVTRSQEGEELENFLTGAAFGAGGYGALSATFAGAKKAIQGISKAAQKSEMLTNAAKNIIARIEDGAEKAYQKNINQEEFLRKAIVFGDESIWEAASSFSNFITSRPAIANNVRNTGWKDIASSKAFKKDVAEKFRGRPDVLKKYAEYINLRKDLAGAVNSLTARQGKSIPHQNWKAIRGEAKSLRARLETAPLDEALKTERLGYYKAKQIGKKGATDSDKATWLGKTWRFMADTQYVLEDIEKRFGFSDLVPALHNMSRQENFFKSYATTTMSLANEIADQAKAKGINLTEIGKLLDSPTSAAEARLSQMAPEAKEVFNAYRAIFDGMRDEANKHGVKIEKLSGDRGYFTMMAKQGDRLAEAVENKLADLGLSKASTEELSAFLKAGGKEADELKRGLSIATGIKKIEGASDLKAAIDVIRKPGTHEAALRQLELAGASAQRVAEDIPEFIREFNPNVVIDTYLRRNLRTSMHREDLNKLAVAAKTLNAAGKTESAAYINNLYKDILGVRTGTLASEVRRVVKDYKAAMMLRSRRANDPVSKVGYKMLAEVPDWMSLATQQLYPYYMGLRIDNYLRNLTQPYILTSGELVSSKFPSYGYKLSLQATGDVFAYGLKGPQINKFSRFLERRGLSSPHQHLDKSYMLEDGIQEGMRTTGGKGIGDISKDVVQGLSNAAMWLYTKSDITNRMVTHMMTKRLVKDLMDGSEAASSVIKANFPASYKKQINKAMSVGDWNKVEHLAENYLMSRTQFNYDKISLSNYGRFMGGVFSMFSKWPSSILGELGMQARSASRSGEDIVASIAAVSQGIITPQAIAKWWGPLITMAALETVTPDAEKSHMRKMLLGRGDLTAWAPVSSGSAILEGDFASPPVFDIGSRLFKAIVQRNPEYMWDAAAPIVPGAVYIKFLTDDIDSWDEALKGR